MNLTKRQYKIFDFIQEKQSVKRAEIEAYISSMDESVSKITILRDLDALLEKNLIKKTGSARSITYCSTETNELLRKYNIEEYFKIEADNRIIKYSQFNFDIFNHLQNIFSPKEVQEIKKTKTKRSLIKIRSNLPYLTPKI
jgi:DeoR/GlpR family transcriptional regulator of sugar metabolism